MFGKLGQDRHVKSGYVMLGQVRTG